MTRAALQMRWSKKEDDVLFTWSGEGRCDARLLYSAFDLRRPYAEGMKAPERTLFEELHHRGYDLTTLRFSIRRRLGAWHKTTGAFLEDGE